MQIQIEIEKIARSPPRTGRELQRYNLDRRQVVGCIPYRFTENKGCSSSIVDELEVLLISSQKCEKMMFPKGGWESDESMEQAVLREALEEAGITGSIQSELGMWSYKSKSQDKMHDGYMFPLLVEEQLEEWPEKDVRTRKWVKVEEAKVICPYTWMNEALDVLIDRLKEKFEDESSSSSSPSPSPLPSSWSMYGLEMQLNECESKLSTCRMKMMNTELRVPLRFEKKLWPNYVERLLLRRNLSLGAESFMSWVGCPH